MFGRCCLVLPLLFGAAVGAAIGGDTAGGCLVLLVPVLLIPLVLMVDGNGAAAVAATDNEGGVLCVSGRGRAHAVAAEASSAAAVAVCGVGGVFGMCVTSSAAVCVHCLLVCVLLLLLLLLFAAGPVCCQGAKMEKAMRRRLGASALGSTG